jgi:DNA-binding transcriptional MerR regulator
MFGIGEFSKITGLTVKTLRFYHEEGLLIPASVDPQTGYRYYAEPQIELARTITFLRTLEFPLPEIKSLLADRTARGLPERPGHDLQGQLAQLPHRDPNPHRVNSMPTQRKRTWREKLDDDKGFPKVAPIDCTKTKRWGGGEGGTFVIPAPREVDGLMRRVRKGKLTTIDELRKILARRHGATIACPITTGIFAWIAAHAAAEAEASEQRGTTTPTPYLRTLKTHGELSPKYPGGIAHLRKRLAAEGHTVTQKGNRFFVKDFDQHLAKLGD